MNIHQTGYVTGLAVKTIGINNTSLLPTKKKLHQNIRDLRAASCGIEFLSIRLPACHKQGSAVNSGDSPSLYGIKKLVQTTLIWKVDQLDIQYPIWNVVWDIVWPMSTYHWEGWSYWPVLQPTTRGCLRCFVFTFGWVHLIYNKS